jgi:hypothetical protein
MTAFLTILGQNRYNSSQRITLWKSIVYFRLCRTVWLNGHLTQFDFKCMLNDIMSKQRLRNPYLHTFSIFTLWKYIVYYRLCRDRIYILLLIWFCFNPQIIIWLRYYILLAISNKFERFLNVYTWYTPQSHRFKFVFYIIYCKYVSVMNMAVQLTVHSCPAKFRLKIRYEYKIKMK